MEKKKRKEPKVKKEKALKPYTVKTAARNTLVKTVIWTLIFFFTAVGVFSFATREDSASVKRTLSKTVTNINQTDSVEKLAGSFAKAFVYDYFTYDQELSEMYVEQINKYAAEGLQLEAPSENVKMTVRSVEVKRASYNEEGNADVELTAKVYYEGILRTVANVKTKDGKDEEKVTETPQAVTKTINVRVPVNVVDGHCAVIAEPLFVADQNKAKALNMPDALQGADTTEAEDKAISQLITNFLTAYYGNDANELSYFVTDHFGSVATVGGDLKLDEVTEVNICGVRGGYEAAVNFTVTDDMITQTQRLYLKIVKGMEGRYYINSLSTRK